MYRALLVLALSSASPAHTGAPYMIQDMTAPAYILHIESPGPLRLGIRWASASAILSTLAASDAKCSLKPHRPSRVSPRYLIVGITLTRTVLTRSQDGGGLPRLPLWKNIHSDLQGDTSSPRSVIQPMTRSVTQHALLNALP